MSQVREVSTCAGISFLEIEIAKIVQVSIPKAIDATHLTTNGPFR